MTSFQKLLVSVVGLGPSSALLIVMSAKSNLHRILRSSIFTINAIPIHQTSTLDFLYLAKSTLDFLYLVQCIVQSASAEGGRNAIGNAAYCLFPFYNI